MIGRVSFVTMDANDPERLAAFWGAVLGVEIEERSDRGRFVFLERASGTLLCFQRVPEPMSVPPRLHLDLLGGADQAQVVERLVGLGARHLDIGQGDVPWVVLADPEGNPFCVMEDRASYADTGPIAALPLDSADPDRDAEFWAWLTGWTDVDGVAPRSLRHPSRRGPLLELCPESAPKGPVKNRLHLDVRLETGDDADEVEAQIAGRGGERLQVDWGELPWRSYTDPSGNEFCVLPAPS